MQTFTLGLGVWFQRLVARNPLVRSSDRVENIAVLLIVALTVLAIPVAGAAGTALHDDLARQFAAQRSERTELRATAVSDSTSVSQASGTSFRTQIQWQFAGTSHTDSVRTADLHAGDPVNIWVDRDGQRVPAPLTDDEAVSQAVVAALTGWLMVAGTGAAAWALLRHRLDRARYAEWDRALDDLAGNDDGRTNRAG